MSQPAPRHLPLQTPRPDGGRFIDSLMGRTNGKTPLVEYLVDEILMRPILKDMLGREWADWCPDRAAQAAYLDNFIQFWYRMGYDFVRFERGMGFPTKGLKAPDTAPGSDKQRNWVNQHEGSIRTWADF